MVLRYLVLRLFHPPPHPHTPPLYLPCPTLGWLYEKMKRKLEAEMQTNVEQTSKVRPLFYPLSPSIRPLPPIENTHSHPFPSIHGKEIGQHTLEVTLGKSYKNRITFSLLNVSFPFKLFCSQYLFPVFLVHRVRWNPVCAGSPTHSSTCCCRCACFTVCCWRGASSGRSASTSHTSSLTATCASASASSRCSCWSTTRCLTRWAAVHAYHYYHLHGLMGKATVSSVGSRGSNRGRVVAVN